MTTLNPDHGSRNWAQLVKVQDGKAIEIDNAPLGKWKTDSGQRPTDEWLAEQGYYGFMPGDEPAIAREEGWYQRNPIGEWTVDEESKTVSPTWNIIYWTDEQKAEVALGLQQEEERKVEQQWTFLREARNSRLAETDWTQLQDVDGAVSAEWAPYRQALRDLPSNTVDPFKPEWPLKPGEEPPAAEEPAVLEDPIN